MYDVLDHGSQSSPSLHRYYVEFAAEIVHNDRVNMIHKYASN